MSDIEKRAALCTVYTVILIAVLFSPLWIFGGMWIPTLLLIFVVGAVIYCIYNAFAAYLEIEIDEGRRDD